MTYAVLFREGQRWEVSHLTNGEDALIKAFISAASIKEQEALHKSKIGVVDHDEWERGKLRFLKWQISINGVIYLVENLTSD